MKRIIGILLAMTTLLLSSCGSDSGWVKNKRHYTTYGVVGYYVYDVDYYQSWLVDDTTTKWYVPLDNTKYVAVPSPKEYVNKLVSKNGNLTFYIYIQKVPQ